MFKKKAQITKFHWYKKKKPLIKVALRFCDNKIRKGGYYLFFLFHFLEFTILA